MELIFVVGEPATGKTTLIKRALDPGSFPETFKFKTLRGMKRQKCLVLGVYGQGLTFEGTDKLSMGVQRDAVGFFHTMREGNYLVVAEGDRLTNYKFFQALLEIGIKIKVFELRADPKVKHQRHFQRKDTQSEVWLKGRATKIHNLRNKLEKRLDWSVLINDTEAQGRQNAALVSSAICSCLKRLDG